MRIYGIDFTSRPKRSKPITCLECSLDGDTLRAGELVEWRDFARFEAALRRPGPWIAGIDFPFGQSRVFIENMGWPQVWAGYVDHVRTLGRSGFRAALDAYRANREPGDKEHRRVTDIRAGSISPQKLYGTPVGLMFYEGAPRLRDARVTVPGLQNGDPDRIVVEAYPGLMARGIIGRRSYKQDRKTKQTEDQLEARYDLLRTITEGVLQPYGLRVEAPMSLAEDPGADHLDALLCAIQAAWAWRQRHDGYGIPNAVDSLEGWIADPAVSTARQREGIETESRSSRLNQSGIMLGEKFDEALKLASDLHREQTRKETPIPYLAHLLAVAGLVLEANAYHRFDDIEDIAIGALLHDAIEDQGHKINLREIRERFGDRVHDIVAQCSDAVIEEEHQKKPPWRERKDVYISKIKDRPRETLLVSCADKLHNARSIMFDFDRIGDAVWDRFTASKEETLWYYRSLYEAFEQAWPDNPLLPEFAAVVQRMSRAVNRD